MLSSGKSFTLFRVSLTVETTTKSHFFIATLTILLLLGGNAVSL